MLSALTLFMALAAADAADTCDVFTHKVTGEVIRGRLTVRAMGTLYILLPGGEKRKLKADDWKVALGRREKPKEAPDPTTTSRPVRHGPVKPKPNPTDPLEKGIWRGFRGIDWKTNAADVPDLILTEESRDNKYYRRKAEKLAIGGAQIERIAYGFYKGRFYFVMVETHGLVNFSSLKDAVFANYGRGYQPNKYIDTWWWGKSFRRGVDSVTMSLKYNEVTRIGRLILSCAEVDAEIARDEAERAKKAREDF